VQATRRAALAGLLAAGVAAVTLHEEPALAAYGQSANIFAEAKKDTSESSGFPMGWLHG
jgi:hypothetical protein